MDMQLAISVLREELRLLERSIAALERVPGRRKRGPIPCRTRKTGSVRNGMALRPPSGEAS